MAMTPEGKVKNGIKKILKDYGIYYYMPMSNGMGRVGAPDFICCYKGKFLGIEAKAPGKMNTVTANQIREAAAIVDAGGRSVVVDNPDELHALFAIMRFTDA